MATAAARKVVLDLCGELLGTEPRRWSVERLDELAELVDRLYGAHEDNRPREGKAPGSGPARRAA